MFKNLFKKKNKSANISPFDAEKTKNKTMFFRELSKVKHVLDLNSPRMGAEEKKNMEGNLNKAGLLIRSKVVLTVDETEEVASLINSLVRYQETALYTSDAPKRDADKTVFMLPMVKVIVQYGFPSLVVLHSGFTARNSNLDFYNHFCTLNFRSLNQGTYLMSDVEVDNFQDEMDELERISAKLDTLNTELALYKQNPAFDEEIIFTVEQKIEEGQAKAHWVMESIHVQAEHKYHEKGLELMREAMNSDF